MVLFKQSQLLEVLVIILASYTLNIKTEYFTKKYSFLKIYIYFILSITQVMLNINTNFF